MNFTPKWTKSWNSLTVAKISLIRDFAFAAWLESLYFLTSTALISAVGKFAKESDDIWISCSQGKTHKSYVKEETN